MFDPFSDYEARGCLRNFAVEKNPARIRRMKHNAFAANVLAALGHLRSMQTLDYIDILATHRILFGAVYPWAGQDRLSTTPGVTSTDAGQADLFALPHDIERNASYALAIASNPETVRARPGVIFGTLAYAHPFLDGNGRTLMTVHADLARRADFHIEWHNVEKPAFLEALAAELHQPGDAMDQLLAQHIKPGGIPIDDTSNYLTHMPGQDAPRSQPRR